ncbi:30S ribosomal protein S18 [Actinomadura sp. WMMB 499]|uniref:30S ribosomal protein S18 n=1 Tax=Actinomadura sp. WMMB 499 TaxID=1219491 RepID=UPI001246B7E0|nr:30S ribosomal protein S18 [Actinomadura sp. WMMB 499]QFG26248.1 30S ribosomal protein S18 [Actinomadura sp. WMMB 499]
MTSPRPRRGERRRKANPLHGVTSIDYKDVDLLRRFISDRGKIRSRRVTGVTVQQQKQLAKAVKNAREMALLPYGSRPPTRSGR